MPLPDILGAGLDVGQLGVLLYIAARVGRVDALAWRLNSRVAAIERWAAARGQVIEEGETG